MTVATSPRVEVVDFVGGPNCGASYAAQDPPSFIRVAHVTGNGQRWVTTYRLVRELLPDRKTARLRYRHVRTDLKSESDQ